MSFATLPMTLLNVYIIIHHVLQSPEENAELVHQVTPFQVNVPFLFTLKISSFLTILEDILDMKH